MIPALAIIGFGRKRTIPLPIPFFLLWPFILLALAVVGFVGWVTRRQGPSPGGLVVAKTALLAMFHLSGLRIDVRSRDHDNFHLWLI
jgi:hypothetical protein